MAAMAMQISDFNFICELLMDMGKQAGDYGPASDQGFLGLSGGCQPLMAHWTACGFSRA
jgi:hypothetical protein